MKRTICLLLLLVLAFSLTALPAFAEEGDSKTDPVEIIDTTPVDPNNPLAPGPGEEIERPGDISDILDIWEINDPENPLAAFVGEGGGWAVVNLLCTILSVLFGGLATGKALNVNRNKKETKIGDENYIVVPRSKKGSDGTVETSLVRKNPLWKAGIYNLLSSFGSIAAFVLTENIWSPMCLMDKWTPLMAGILAVSAGVYGLAAGGKTLTKEVADQVLAAVDKTKG
jgi:hypothetical protein